MSREKVPKLQEAFLNKLRKEGVWVSLTLLNGERLYGHIVAFDPYCLLIKGYGDEEHLVYKHAIAYISPQAGGER